MAILLNVGEIVSVPAPGTALVKVDNDGNLSLVADDGSEIVFASGGVETVTGEGIDNTDPDNPVLIAATNTEAGAMPAESMAGDLKVAAAVLTDADATVTPGNDHVSRYILPAGTLTANRVLTISPTNGVNTDAVEIVVLDTSANTYQLKNGGGSTIVTHGASSPAKCYRIYRSGGDYILNEQFFCGA